VSPATGQQHRVRIEIPNRIEFEQAEIGSATTTSTSAIRLDLTDTYGQFNRIRHSGPRRRSRLMQRAALAVMGAAAAGVVLLAAASSA
jgi:hypothetical protein